MTGGWIESYPEDVKSILPMAMTLETTVKTQAHEYDFHERV